MTEHDPARARAARLANTFALLGALPPTLFALAGTFMQLGSHAQLRQALVVLMLVWALMMPVLAHYGLRFAKASDWPRTALVLYALTAAAWLYCVIGYVALKLSA
jgi:hypothetical protein